MKTTVVIFDRDTGRLNTFDSGPDYTLVRGTTMNESKIMVAFQIPDSEFSSGNGKRSRIERLLTQKHVRPFFRDYELTAIPQF